MPAILERLVRQLKAKGFGEQQAYAIATHTLQKSGSLDHHGNATEKGTKRGKMGASGRAKERASRGTDHKPSDYKYSKMTNRATLKK